LNKFFDIDLIVPPIIESTVCGIILLVYEPEQEQKSKNNFFFIKENKSKTISNFVNMLKNYESIVKEPYDYVSKDKGKEVRVKLIDAFNQFTELTQEKLDQVKNITQKLHNASLL
jgi:hypothetical protein